MLFFIYCISFIALFFAVAFSFVAPPCSVDVVFMLRFDWLFYFFSPLSSLSLSRSTLFLFDVPLVIFSFPIPTYIHSPMVLRLHATLLKSVRQRCISRFSRSKKSDYAFLTLIIDYRHLFSLRPSLCWLTQYT